LADRGTRLPITLCMLTRDEEDRLAASLGAMRERVARMVVVDAESEDRTVEVARRLGAEVFVRPWEGFVAARRHLLSLSATPWTLMIDADEIVGAELWEELASLGFPDCKAAGLQLRRRTVYEGRTLRRSFQPDWKTALFRTENASFEDRAVHEAVRVRGSVARLKTEIRHYSYRSDAEHYRRIEKYAELGARDLAARGKKAGIVGLWLRPAWRWFAELFLLGGVVDGRLGLTMAARSAYSIHLRYRYLQRLLRDAAR
jgi:glycosyltransferase involved in cell wall biosynthesis